MEKKLYGQFFTTNSEYILIGMSPPKDISVIEPFAGNLNLLEPFKNIENPELYDLFPLRNTIIQRDSLLNPPSYNNKFVITNPPFLSKNKSEKKEIYNKYHSDDLWKCFIISILNDPPLGGILVLPINFLSSVRKSDINLRKKFTSIFRITRINIFEETVFNDTTTAVCSLQFKIKSKDRKIPIHFYPSGIVIKINLTKTNNYCIGHEICCLKASNKFFVCRATRDTIVPSNISVKCLDDSVNSKIKFYYSKVPFIDTTPNLTARSEMSLVISPSLNKKQQKKLIEKANAFLDEMRNKYNSLFLSNYREAKNGFARKRISFSQIFSIIGHLLLDFE